MSDLLKMMQIDSAHFPRMSKREAEARVFADKRAIAVIDEQRRTINGLISQRNELLAALKSLNYTASENSPNAKIVRAAIEKAK